MRPISADDEEALARLIDAYGAAAEDGAGLRMEAEGRDYRAAAAVCGGLAVRLRTAKVTPRKVGQFVTVWKRVGDGPIQPFDAADDVDFVVVLCRAGGRRGAFVFPKAEMVRRDVFSRQGRGGKRAIRVYPPWDAPQSAQALAAQGWQGGYFIDLPAGPPSGPARLAALLGVV